MNKKESKTKAQIKKENDFVKKALTDLWTRDILELEAGEMPGKEEAIQYFKRGIEDLKDLK